MPRIRKKTSKRISTHQRAKFKHKVAEGRKKKKKEAKKNPQWKSKKRKDPGIPNNFPYKEQILAEIVETRRQADDAKQRRKEEKKAARNGLLVEATQTDVSPDNGLSYQSSSSKARTNHEVPMLLNPDLPDLKAVLMKADVILHVLDARDPASFRLPHIEELAAANGKTKLVFVINKIDLVPREALAVWAKYLRTKHVAFLFRSASTFLPKTPVNDPKIKGKAKETADDAIGANALLEHLGQHAIVAQSEVLQVAVVGLTNSGKSAIVNSLARKSVVPIYAPTSSADAWSTTTTRAFEVPVEVAGRKINLVDTPGVSLQGDQDHDETLKTRDMLLRCRGRVDKVKDPIPAVEHIVSMADTQDLMVQYNLPAFAPGDCSGFLAGVARSAGLLKKGGKADLTQAARTVLKDWTSGKLPFYTDAPPEESNGAADVAGEGTEEASVKNLYAQADEMTLVSIRMKREMRKAGGLVRIRRGELEVRRVVLDVPFVVEQMESESEGEEDEVDAEDDDEEDIDGQKDVEGEGNLEGESENEHDRDEPSSLPLKGKRKREKIDAATPAPRPTKKVVFAAGAHDRKEKQQARSALKSATNPNSKKVGPAPTAKKVTAAKAKASTGTDDAYDFDQFFKS